MDPNWNFGAFNFTAGKPSNLQKRRSNSPVRHHRAALDGVFANVTVQSSSTARMSNAPAKFPFTNWGTLRRNTQMPSKSLDFTIKMTSEYRIYSEEITENYLHTIFTEATTTLTEIKSKVSENEDLERVVQDIINDSMIELVFSSNYIERVGAGFDITYKICKRIFNGDDVKAEDISERSPDYQKQLEALTAPPRSPTLFHVIRSRREIIQHAKALTFITTAIALNNESLSEDLIKRTHRILVEGIDMESGRKWEQYAGRYRQGDEHVHAGNNNFVNPRAIPQAMRTLIEKFNEDLEKAEASEEIDPIWLAAKYCQDFVLIHPFIDGNGRTCRLILNAILLKYTGTLVAIGGDEVAREQYIGIVRRAGIEMEGPGEFAAFVLSKVHEKLGTIKKRLRGK